MKLNKKKKEMMKYNNYYQILIRNINKQKIQIKNNFKNYKIKYSK